MQMTSGKLMTPKLFQEMAITGQSYPIGHKTTYMNLHFKSVVYDFIWFLDLSN